MSRFPLSLGVLVACSAPVAGQSFVQWTDPAQDATIRRTDPGADGPVMGTATVPDVVHASLSGWAPADADADPYTGSVVPGAAAHFFRLTVSFRGVVNPPGPLDFAGEPYEPFRFGPNPVYGYLDVDVDGDMDTGGVLGPGASQRYTANVARFGRVPTGPLAGRTAIHGEQVDGNFNSSPQIERSGADFSLAMCGCWDVSIVSEGGDGDGIFEAGETWTVRGRFFERAPGYEEASGTVGGSTVGRYDPYIDVRFMHSISSDTTTIMVVFPLDMAGAAMLLGGGIQDMDFCFGDSCVDDYEGINHFSVAEAIWNVILYAENVGADWPASVLADGWAGRDEDDYLDPTAWDITALFGMPYVIPEDAFFAWSDTGMNEVFADVDGDGLADDADESQLVATVYELDGGPDDADGVINGVVVLQDPGPGFHIFDMDANGQIDVADRYAYGDPADLNDDGTVDLLDFVTFQTLVHLGDPDADFNLDQTVDVKDFVAFQAAASK